jgi:hypothetical protein
MQCDEENQVMPKPLNMPTAETVPGGLREALHIMLAEQEGDDGSFTMETDAFYRRLRELLCDYLLGRRFLGDGSTTGIEKTNAFIKTWFVSLLPQITMEERSGVCVVTFMRP